MGSIEERFEKLNVWRRGDERAPHKPLLVLLALAAYTRGERQVRFVDCEGPLTALLREFGQSTRSYHPEYPFWRLANDGLWAVTANAPLPPRASNTDPTKSSLRKADARGQFKPELLRALEAQPRLVGRIAARILDAHFPDTLHEDILQAVGLDVTALELTSPMPPEPALQASLRRRRDPNFRNAVLVAYEFRCAVCRLDLRLGALSIGLDAAHVKWHQANGPSEVVNGLALCTLHHKLFDLGAFTLDPQFRVLVSERVHGTTGFDETLLRHHGSVAARPVRNEHLLHNEFLDWHLDQVFKREARPLA